MEYTKFSSGAQWEDIVGYSRAVKAGNIIEISGTVAADNKKNFAPESAYEQTIFIIKKIEAVLNEAGAELTNVIRTRIYVTDISKWEEVGKAHGKFFKDIKPATSMVEVSSLIHQDYLVEIEATAIV